MKIRSIYRNLVIAISIFSLSACEKQWDDHIEVDNGRETETIMQVLSSTPETSIFASLLKSTGYSELLSGDKAITVFAPLNSALETLDFADEDATRAFVRNHIAYLSYTISNNNFSKDSIEMLNSKILPTGNMSVGGAAVNAEKFNIKTANGILHLMNEGIAPKLNIWEYLQAQSGYNIVDFIVSRNSKEMDMDKSVFLEFDENGNRVYDTVWIDKNIVLDELMINNESQRFTFVLMDNTVASSILSKYAKYFTRPDVNQQDSILMTELVRDCVLLPVKINAAGQYETVFGVKVDINGLTSEYEASNGYVYIISAADVKIYENKIKTKIIEAEDYKSTYSNRASWALRYRPWASGGYDMMMNGISRDLVNYTYLDENDELVESSVTYTYYYNNAGSAATYASANNCYIEFEVDMYSVDYEIYWLSHDDIDWHSNKELYESKHNTTVVDTLWRPLPLTQKMLISLPDEEKVSRSSVNGSITNNFNNSTVFAATSIAGGDPATKEVKLNRYNTTDGDSEVRNFMPNLESMFAGSDAFGDKDILKCPRYGKTTLMVANTVRETGNNVGLIFLDYIKLVPKVDVND
ncbi:hypothetical protein D0T53_09355 [Dysgonomonas sp. 216]|uniref:fasciclin domain-containing protein n=1 Tax=Dysgonomonas sp. 216 TaxID=2302934 RepID=UPI0013D271A9|nr:fasciclin domain-containing protein [Dysgonomonas sp. 216]NDW19119.1 hypothetical protein [Dysgonomonas sp. 216]